MIKARGMVLLVAELWSGVIIIVSCLQSIHEPCQTEMLDSLQK